MGRSYLRLKHDQSQKEIGNYHENQNLPEGNTVSGIWRIIFGIGVHLEKKRTDLVETEYTTFAGRFENTQ